MKGNIIISVPPPPPPPPPLPGGWLVRGMADILAGWLLGCGFVCGPCSVVMPRYRSGFVCGPLFAGLSCWQVCWSAVSGVRPLPPPPLLMLFHGVGGGSWDNQQFGRATFGARFCSVGRALRSCPATRAVLCVGRFLRGCLADNSVVRPPPSLCLCFFSSLFKFLSFWIS